MLSSWIFFGRRSLTALIHIASFISGKKLGESTHEDYVRRLGIPEGEGDLLALYDVHVLLEILLECCRYVRRGTCQPQVDGGGKYLLVVDDDPCRLLAVVDVPQRLEKLEGEEEIDFAVRDERRVDLLAEPEMGCYVAPRWAMPWTSLFLTS